MPNGIHTYVSFSSLLWYYYVLYPLLSLHPLYSTLSAINFKGIYPYFYTLSILHTHTHSLQERRNQSSISYTCTSNTTHHTTRNSKDNIIALSFAQTLYLLLSTSHIQRTGT